MRSAVAFALLALVSTGAAAQPFIDSVKILDFGIYSAEQTRSYPTRGTAMGVVTELRNYKLVTQTETVRARIGMRFGVKYQIVGRPQNHKVAITWITHFPAAGMINANGEKFEKNEFEMETKIGEQTYRTYTFDEAWEIVPGDWVFEFHYQGRKLGEKRFTVVTP
jgi:hypothetical protein